MWNCWITLGGNIFEDMREEEDIGVVRTNKSICLDYKTWNRCYRIILACINRNFIYSYSLLSVTAGFIIILSSLWAVSTSQWPCHYLNEHTLHSYSWWMEVNHVIQSDPLRNLWKGGEGQRDGKSSRLSHVNDSLSGSRSKSFSCSKSRNLFFYKLLTPPSYFTRYFNAFLSFLSQPGLDFITQNRVT